MGGRHKNVKHLIIRRQDIQETKITWTDICVATLNTCHVMSMFLVIFYTPFQMFIFYGILYLNVIYINFCHLSNWLKLYIAPICKTIVERSNFQCISLKMSYFRNFSVVFSFFFKAGMCFHYISLCNHNWQYCINHYKL